MRITYFASDGSPELLFEGSVSSAQLEHVAKSLIQAPDFARGRGLIVDVRKHEDRYESHELKRLAESLAALAPILGKRCALVISPDDALQFGLSRMFVAFSENRGVDVGLFFEAETAQDWITHTPLKDEN